MAKAPSHVTIDLEVKLIAIVAHDPDHTIGRHGKLPWHLPEDLKFFKETTTGHPILMGRTTFESIGRPLPKRQNIVLTRDPAWSHNGLTVIHHPDELVNLALDQVFIIGGAQIYQLFLPLLDELIVTHVYQKYDGDTHFPEYRHLFKTEIPVHKTSDFEVIRYLRS